MKQNILIYVFALLLLAACAKEQAYAPAYKAETHPDWYDAGGHQVPERLELKADFDTLYIDEPFRIEATLVFRSGDTQRMSYSAEYGTEGYIEQTNINEFVIYGPGNCTVRASATYLGQRLEASVDVTANGGFRCLSDPSFRFAEPILSVTCDPDTGTAGKAVETALDENERHI